MGPWRFWVRICFYSVLALKSPLSWGHFEDCQGFLDRLFHSHTEAPRFDVRLAELADRPLSQTPAPYFFDWQRPVIPLSVENGDEDLGIIRINFDLTHFEISSTYVDELSLLFRDRPDLELWVSGELPGWSSGLGSFAPEQSQLAFPVNTRVFGKAQNLWARDGSKPLSLLKNGKSAVVLPRSMNPDRDLKTYQQPLFELQRAGEIEIRKSQFQWEGGDIVVGAKHIFVGYEVLKSAQIDFGFSIAEALEALKHEFGKSVIPVGALDRSTGFIDYVEYHVDLFLTVIRDRISGREKILLGSMSKAIDLMDPRLSNIHLGRTRKFENTEKFLNELFKPEDPAKPWQPNFLEIQNTEIKLNALAAYFESLGYEVERVPFFSFGEEPPESYTGPTFFSYNNIVLGQGVALIPDLGILAWDIYMKQLLTRMGYKVYSFKTAQLSSVLDAGILCMTEVLRKPANCASRKSAGSFFQTF